MPSHAALQRIRLQTVQNSSGGAKQSDRESSNINTIVANYFATGIMGKVNAQTPLYGDFTQPQDLQTQLHRVMDAQARFDALPADLRKAASNDPVKFLEMTQDDDGLALLTELGLVMVDDLEPTPDPPIVADPPPADPPIPADPPPES